MAEGPYATLYWAQFLETDIQQTLVQCLNTFSRQVRNKKSAPRQLLMRLKGRHVWDDASIHAMA